MAGLVRYKRGDIPGAARCLRRSLDLQFSTEAAIYLSGFLSVGAGTPAQARRFAEDAAARDPLSAFAFRQVSWVDLVDGRFDASVARLQESVARYGPLDWVYGCLLGVALACAGRETEAGAAFDQIGPIDGFAWADPSRLFQGRVAAAPGPVGGSWEALKRAPARRPQGAKLAHLHKATHIG